MILNAYSDSASGLYDVAVKSCGHIFATYGRRISRVKGRADWLLFYVAKGSEKFFLNSEIVAKEGSFIFFKPNEKQEHVCEEETTAEFYYVHFTAPDDFDLFGFNSSQVYFAKPSAKIRDLFEEILNELQRKQTVYEKLCSVKFLEIITLLLRRHADKNNPHGRYFDKITAIIQLMNREYYKDYSLEDYAEVCNMSKYHFVRVFKGITGCSPVEYKNKIRIEHAKELLEDDSIPIGEIGLRVGFSSPSYFCDAFKQKTSLTPIAYRQSVIEK